MEEGKYIPNFPFGAIYLEGPLAKLTETAEMTRLKHIKQLGTLYLFYPTANHSRYIHSCGVAYLVNEFFRHIDPLAVSFPNRHFCEVAALIHDIGQPTWSHSGELFPKLRGFGDRFRHGKISAEMIRNGEKFDKYFSHWERPRIYDIIRDPNERELIAKVIEGRPPLPEDLPNKEKAEKKERFLGQLINSHCDFDRVEYLYRDSCSIGAYYTPFSTALIYENVGIIPVGEENLFGFTNEVFAQSFVLTRELTYAYFYKDPRDLIAKEMLGRAWNKMFSGQTKITDEDVYGLWFLTDAQLLERMKDNNDHFVKRIASMIESQKIYHIAKIIDLKGFDVVQRERIIEIDKDRIKLLQLEDKICKTVGIDQGDLIISTYIHETPPEVNMIVLDSDKKPRLLGDFALMKPLYNPDYFFERSKLLISTFKDDKKLQNIVVKETKKRLS